ncbi:MAG: hypothetical protein WBE34_01840 [Candidatus Nitrosopolaris sp.]
MVPFSMEEDEILDSRAIKMAKELQKDKHESAQLDVDPEQVLEEQEKKQPHSTDE